MLRDWLYRFRKDESGSQTIEILIWFPIFVTLFVLILDVAILFMNHARIVRMIQDANRAYAVGEFRTCPEVRTWLEPRLQAFAPGAQAFCTLQQVDSQHRVKTAVTTVTVPVAQLDLSGATSLLGSLTMRVEGKHGLESWL